MNPIPWSQQRTTEVQYPCCFYFLSLCYFQCWWSGGKHQLQTSWLWKTGNILTDAFEKVLLDKLYTAHNSAYNLSFKCSVNFSIEKTLQVFPSWCSLWWALFFSQQWLIMLLAAIRRWLISLTWQIFSLQTANPTKIPAEFQQYLDIISVMWSLIPQFLQVSGNSAWDGGMHGMCMSHARLSKPKFIPNLCINPFSDE